MSAVWKQELNLIQRAHNFYKTAHKILRFRSDNVQDVFPHLITCVFHLISWDDFKYMHPDSMWRIFTEVLVLYITNAEEIFIEIYKAYFKVLDQIITT